MADPETTAVLSKISTQIAEQSVHLENLKEGQTQLRQDAKAMRIESAEGRARIRNDVRDLTISITQGDSATVALNDKVDSHIAQDETRFGLLWKVILGAGGSGGLMAVAAKVLMP